MDLKTYYNDLRAKDAELVLIHPDGVVYVTSLFHRERNSTPGSTLSATTHNAARVITDGTHREATQEEIDGFLQHQQNELRRNAATEQKNKRQYIVVVDQKDANEPVFAGAETGKSAIVGSRGRSSGSKEQAQA
jgi:hypothetical protein